MSAKNAKNIEAVYSLSPMQQGMLFHTLFDPSSGLYFEQFSWTLKGELDVSAFKRAWQRVVDRHPVLRTAFISEGFDNPLQVVGRRAKLPWEEHNWRGLPVAEQQVRLEAFLEADRSRGFELSKAPLMRCALIHLTEDTSQFVWSHHHLLLDGWSVTVLLQEVFSYYRAFCRGEELSLEVPRHYGDYIAWLQQQDLREAEAYWREALKGFTAPTSLGINRTPSDESDQQAGFSKHRIQLPRSTTEALQEIARQHHLTLNTLVQGAWAILLSRYSGEREVVYGAVVSGRPADLDGSESMVGLFINTLPVRVSVKGGESLVEWLKNLQSLQVEARQYEYSPLVQVQGWSEVPRGLPLFDSILIFENYPMDISLQGTGRSIEVSNPKVFDRTNYPLTVMAESQTTASGSELLLQITYDCARFEGAAVGRMLTHLQRLLEAMASNPQSRLSQLPLITEAERQQVLVEWNDTRADYSFDKCIHQLIEAQVEKTPDAVAVVFENEETTYRQLNDKANALARRLVARSVGKGSYVPVLMDKSTELAISLLAILKSGAAFVPLDVRWPIERLKQISSELNSEFILINHTTPHSEASLDLPLLPVYGRPACEPTPNLDIAVDSQDPIYAIFTSGSTGKPKAAINQHRGILNRFFYMNERYGSKQSDVILQTSSHIFDSYVWQLFWPLMNGAKTVISSPTVGFDMDNVLDLLEREKITFSDFVPSLLAILVDQMTNDSRSRERFSRLRQLLIGGEAMNPKVVYQLKSHLPNVGITNIYGPTETSIGVIFYEVPDEHTDPIPIGKPMKNVYALILDKDLNPLPVGVPGDLYLGGVCVGLGYLNNEKATNAAFIQNPFEEIDSDKLYLTGDLACWLPDGNIKFLGRNDHQVKIRGIRIELGEIESVLSEHESLKEAVVVAREDVPGQKRLVAYIVSRQGVALNTGELHAYLKQRLPDYMIPSVFVPLDEMPLMPGGKVDRRALLPPDTGHERGAELAPPRTPEERILAEIWSKVLRVNSLGIHDNFFELGGDSILSLQIIAKARQAGLHLTPKQVFERQTIAELAAVARTAATAQAEQGIVTGPVPLTPIQHRFFEHSLSNPHHWNQAALLELHQAIDPSSLRSVAQALLEHHDALRLRFEQTVTGWRQFNTGKSKDVPFAVVNLSELPEAEQEAAFKVESSDAQTTLNISNGPLARFVMFDLGANKPARLLIVVHHLAVDGVSWRILLEDLETAYQQISRGETIQLPPKTTSFKRWAGRLTDYSRSAQLRQELAHWLAEVEREVTRLPVDYPGGENTEASSRMVSVSLDVEQTRALLQEVPRVYHTQINEVLLTALVEAFANWTGGQSLLVDLEGHGREPIFDDVDLSRTVGWFTLLYPVALAFKEAERPGGALKAVKEQLRRVPGGGMSYGLLRYLSDGTEEMERLRVPGGPEVCFNYFGQLDNVIQQESLFSLSQKSKGVVRSQNENRQYLLEVNAGVASERLQLTWTYSENLYHHSTVENLAAGFIAALRSLITHCQSPDAGGHTPSDFPKAKLSQDNLNSLLAKMAQSKK